MEALSGIGLYSGIGSPLDTWDSDERQRRREPSTGVPSRRERSDTDATGLALTPEKKEKIRQLEQRDREVRAHERAHQAAAGWLALGGASFSLSAGPDGRMYAVGGEVHIDTSRENDPDATIAKARQIRAAANAPADPSAQDRAVAAEASRMESEARRDKARETDVQTGRSSIGGPASISGPPELSGPAASVSGPPRPLNRRTDELGRGGIGDVDGPFSAADYQRQYAAASRAADVQAAADAAYARYRTDAGQSRADAYARAPDQEAQSRLDTADTTDTAQTTLPPRASVEAALPPETAVPGADAQPIDVTRAADPAAVLAAGSYPLDRPSSALYAFNSADFNALAIPGRAEYAAPPADPRALREASDTTRGSAAARQHASSVYRRVAHVPTSLAPYGTGISHTV